MGNTEALRHELEEALRHGQREGLPQHGVSERHCSTFAARLLPEGQGLCHQTSPRPGENRWVRTRQCCSPRRPALPKHLAAESNQNLSFAWLEMVEVMQSRKAVKHARRLPNASTKLALLEGDESKANLRGDGPDAGVPP